jgi:hypothetical protein
MLSSTSEPVLLLTKRTMNEMSLGGLMWAFSKGKE